MKELRIRGNNLQHVVKSGYGQSTHTDVKVLAYNVSTRCFEGRVWDGKFGPDDNTTWIEIPLDAIVARFGVEATEQLCQGEAEKPQ